MKLRRLVGFLAVALSSVAFAHGQNITIPAIPMTVPVTINGTTVKITFTVPAQTVPLPTITATLPSGLTWDNGTLAVAGNITATQISLTGGPALPTCASNLFLFQSVSGVLQPACYVVPTFTAPSITVSQATSPVNTLSFANSQ